MRSPWFGSGRTLAAEAVAELALLAAIADGRFDQTARDRLALAVRDRPELAGLDWDWVIGRAEALDAEAPLFTEARTRIANQLTRSDHAEPAVRLAASLLATDPDGDARFVLDDVVARLGVDWPEAPEVLPRPARCAANDPEAPAVRTFADALAHARGEERRLLLYKLQAVRQVGRHLGDGARLLELGHQVPTGPFVLRFDARIEAEGKLHHCRFLAAREALHPAEHAALRRAVETLGLGQRLVLAHQEPLLPPDASLWASMDPEAAPRFQL